MNTSLNMYVHVNVACILLISLIDQCGKSVVGEVTKCFCGASIGGKVYDIAQENAIKEADKYDYNNSMKLISNGYIVSFYRPLNKRELTKKGYCLELPKERPSVSSPQRELSPLSNCLIRILLHSVCIWAASSNDKV